MAMRSRVQGLAVLLAVCGGLSPFGARAEQDGTPRVSVVFVKPETFTDAGYSKNERSSPAILLQLQRFIVETAARQLPESLSLEVKITNIDLAGDFELFRGPQFDHVRVNKSIYPPRIALEFRVFDASNQTIRQSKRELTDLDYQLRIDYSPNDPLRYEKEMLRDWLRAELRGLHASRGD